MLYIVQRPVSQWHMVAHKLEIQEDPPMLVAELGIEKKFWFC